MAFVSLVHVCNICVARPCTVWQCLFELQTAITMGHHCKVDIILTAEQLRLFKTFVARNGYGGVDTLLLNKIKSENAESSQKADLLSIQKLIESTIGYERLDGMVRKRLRQWQEDEAGAIKSNNRTEMITGGNRGKHDEDLSSIVKMVHSYISTSHYMNAQNHADAAQKVRQGLRSKSMRNAANAVKILNRGFGSNSVPWVHTEYADAVDDRERPKSCTPDSGGHIVLDMSGATAAASGSLSTSPALLGAPPTRDTLHETASPSAQEVKQIPLFETMKQDRRRRSSFSGAIAELRASADTGNASPSPNAELPALGLPAEHLPKVALSLVSEEPHEGGEPSRGTGTWVAMLGTIPLSSPSKLPRPVLVKPPPADSTLQQPKPSHLPRPATASKPKAKGASRFSLRRKSKAQRKKEGKQTQSEEKQRRRPEAANADGTHDQVIMPNPGGFVNWEPVEQRGLEWDPQQRRIATAPARFSTGITSTNTKPADAPGTGAAQESLV